MKLLLTFLIGMLAVVSLHAQDSTFNIIYKETSGKGEVAFHSVEIPGENAFLVSAVQFGGGIDRMVILKIRNNGTILQEKFYEDPGYAFYPENIINTSNGHFIVTGTKALGSDGGFMLYRLNNNLDTIWTRLHHIGNGNEGTHKVIETADRGFLLVGFSQTFPNNDAQGYILKTDSLGQKEWILVHGDSTHGEENWDVLELADSTFIVLSDRTYQQNDNIVLLKVSPQGQLIWERELNTPVSHIGSVILPVTDSIYLIGGSQSTSSSSGKPMVMKAHQSGNIEWIKTYSQTPLGTFWDGSKIDSNSFVFAGAIKPDMSTEVTGYAVRINANGNAKWATVVSPDGKPNDNSQDYFYGVNALSDGGVLCTGFTFKGPVSGTQDAWILKLDSLGQCDTSLCFPWLVGMQELETPSELIVYPNPANDILYIDSEIPGLVNIYTMTGQKKYSAYITEGSNHFSVKGLDPGIYLIELITDATKRIVGKLVIIR